MDITAGKMLLDCLVSGITSTARGNVYPAVEMEAQETS